MSYFVTPPPRMSSVASALHQVEGLPIKVNGVDALFVPGTVGRLEDGSLSIMGTLYTGDSQEPGHLRVKSNPEDPDGPALECEYMSLQAMT